jgi:nicotinate-nucleotide pyrophosphorylase (carboxylating)
MRAGIEALVRDALEEDVGQGDVTTNATVSADARCRAILTAKQDGVLSGMALFRAVFDMLEARIEEWSALADGSAFYEGDRVASFVGNTREVLTGERVALNFIQRLSGVATHTAAFVKAVAGTGAKICDTRKTTPLMRRLEKQAVVHGGGINHRYALFDGVLIKENHIVGAGGVTSAIKKAAASTHHLMRIGVEVTNLEELNEAIQAGADAVLLDNMSLDLMREAVERTKGTDIIVEASGNMTLERVRSVAELGVHVISVGAITHSAPAVDLSLKIINV